MHKYTIIFLLDFLFNKMKIFNVSNVNSLDASIPKKKNWIHLGLCIRFGVEGILKENEFNGIEGFLKKSIESISLCKI